MKRITKSILALLLALLMLFEVGELGIAYALDGIDRAVNPAKNIELTVPERFGDGNNWFFIPEASYTVSEKSTEKLYVPVQRTGDLDAETEVTLKVIDLSAHHDVDYSVEIYKEAVDPEIVYGDLDSARYGYVKDKLLYTADVSAKLPAKTVGIDPETGEGKVVKSVLEEEQYVTIPASVFRFCGYDALVLTLSDAKGAVIAESDQMLVSMDSPMNLSLNGGKTLSLKADESVQTRLSYNTTAFINNGAVIYTTADPNVAEVDENGSVAAVGNGRTTLTATVLPSGKTASIPVTVTGYSGPVTPTTPDVPAEQPAACDGGEDCPLTAFTDLNSNAWYHDGVHWALENGVMQGAETNSFAPNGATTRAMLVTMLYRLEGEPETDYEMSFTDVEAGKWYTEAIRWAAANGIVKGYSDERFGPMNELSREQLAAILYRYAQTKGLGFTGLWSFRLDYDDADQVSDWAHEAMCWMVMRNVIQGTGARVLPPKSGAARAQVATMLMRYEAIDE